MPGGRPLEYTEEITEKAKEYLASCVDEEKEFHKTRGENTNTFEKFIKCNIPTIEGLAVHLHLAKATIYDWEEKYPEFSDVVGELREKQAQELLSKGLSGDYNASIAKLMLVKHGYRDATEHSGANGGPIQLQTINYADPAAPVFTKKLPVEPA